MGTGRPAKFVVPVSLNKASTRAFLDAIRLSKPGDEIHVIFIKCHHEREESDYTTALRKKYEASFAFFKDGDQHVFSKFHDRETKFLMVEKKRRESTPQAIMRYSEPFEADFIAVGTQN